MSNKREPPNATTEMPFHEAVLSAANFLQCNINEFANSVGTDESEIARWQLRPQDLDQDAPFRINMLLLQRRILVTKLNGFNALLQKHFGSEIEAGKFLDSPWVHSESDSDSKSWRQLAVEIRGLADACDELELWLKKNTDFSEAN